MKRKLENKKQLVSLEKQLLEESEKKRHLRKEINDIVKAKLTLVLTVEML